MNPENLIPFLVMTGSALTTAQLARHAWRERSSPDEIEFALLMLCATIYAGAAACEYLVPSPQAKILCSQVAYAGLVNLPPLWLLYALRHSHSSAWVTRRRVAILWIMPVIILVLAATNAWHGLIWPSITPINDRPGARLVYEHGPGILALVLYAYPLLLTGSVLLVRAAWKAPRMFGWQAGLMVAAALFPWLGNLLYLLKLNPWPGLDLTPPAFMFAGLLITFNASRYHVFDIAPVAREAVFAGMGDAVLVLDNQHRLVDLNQAAQRWTGLSQKDIGREIAHILTPQHLSGQITELTLHQGDEPAIFDLSFSPLQDARGRPRGRVALLHDIRRERQLLEAEHRRNAQLTALQSIGQAVVASLELEQLFATVVKVLHDTFDYPYVTIYRLQNGSLHLGAQVGSPDEQVIATIPVGRSVCGRAARTRQAQLVVDINQDPDYLRTAPDVQSEICVPLMQKQTVLGVLDVETCSPRRLDETDLEQLNMFATQVVIAINNARVFQAERQQRQLAEALRAVGLALSESLDFEAVMDRLLDEIGKVIPYDAVTVLLVEDGSGTACVAGRRGSERIGARLGWRTMSLDFNLAATRNLARMIETGQPLIIRDVLSEPAWAGVSTTAQLRAWLGAPITVRGRVIGFLSLDKAEPGFYTPDHAQGLAAFTGQTAIAIENARAFTEMQRQSEKERLLLAATRDFTSGLDREAVLQAIVTHMVNGLGADGCTISRWDAAQDRLVTLLDYEVVPGAPVEPPGQVHPLESFPHTRAVLQQRTPLFISQADPQIDPAERALLQQFGNQAVLMLPLVVGRIPQVFGLIELFRKANSRPFAPGELAMAESFASQAAVALENARLYEEKQRQAVIDELCGIYNRRGLFELARIEFERSQRFNRPLALLFIDIDHFKQFNDRYSYAVGDQVLRQVADCIGVKVREFDLLGRYGGEEFVVLLPEADAKVARQVAERVRQAVQRLSISTGLDETSVTVSIGVAYKDLATENLETLLELAGQALHEAKNAGRNRVVAAGGSNLFGAAAGSSSLAAAEPAAPAVVPPTSPGASPPPGPAWR